MRYDEDANHKLFWAIAVGLVVATIMFITSGCSTSTLAKDCKQVQNDDEWFKCKKPKPWE